MAKKKLRVALIFGGTSEERKVSIKSANSVRPALVKKYKVTDIEVKPKGDWIKKIHGLKSKIDVAFLALHGPGGEDGTVQAVLELLGIKYTCSGVLASALAMDKAMTKRVVASEGFTVPAHIILNREDYRKNPKKYLSQLRGKLVVKPNSIGSSFGVTISSDKLEIKKGIESAFQHDEQVLIEQYIEGRELTVPVLGNRNPKALPVIEIVPKNGSKFFDFQAKYNPSFSDEIVPAPITKALAKELQEIAVAVHQLLDCRGFTRTDFMVTKNGKINFLEINTIPGMTNNSLTPKAAKVAGLSFEQFLDKVIALALE